MLFILQGFFVDAPSLDDETDLLEIDIARSCQRDYERELRELDDECQDALRSMEYRNN